MTTNTPLTDAYRAADVRAREADANWQACECPACTDPDREQADCSVYNASYEADVEHDAARDAWLASDEPRMWDFGGESLGGGSQRQPRPIRPSEVREALVAWTESGDWDPELGTIWVRDYAEPIDPVTDEPIEDHRIEETTTIEPPAPDCTDGHEHDWRSPLAVVGGIKENPGVWGHGGGVIIREVCRWCARYRVTDTWDTNPDTGEQGLTSVGYQDADEDSLAWIAERRDAKMIEAVSEIADLQRRGDGRYAIIDYAPDSSTEEYDGDTSPGSAWYEACERLLAEVQAVLPEGWAAEWSGDDLVIEVAS